MCRSEWLIECKNHLEFKAIKILLTTYLPFSWFALNLSKISRDNVKIQKGFLKKKSLYLINSSSSYLLLITVEWSKVLYGIVLGLSKPLLSSWFGSFLYGSGGIIVRVFEPFLDKPVGNLVGGRCGVQVKVQVKGFRSINILVRFNTIFIIWNKWQKIQKCIGLSHIKFVTSHCSEWFFTRIAHTIRICKLGMYFW